MEGAFLEGENEVAVTRACAFRGNTDRAAKMRWLFEEVFCSFEGFDGLTAIGAVDGNVTTAVEGLAEEWDEGELTFVNKAAVRWEG